MTPTARLNLKTQPETLHLYVHTFGCQMNDYDSHRVSIILASHGYQITQDLQNADVIFLNTCSVREKAEQKAYSLLGRLRRLKTGNPGLKIVLGGCLAQQLGKDLLARFDYLDLVIGTRAISSIAGILEKVRRTGERLVFLPEEDDAEGFGAFPGGASMKIGHVVAPVTIMQGCNNFCAYCIVPHVRGRERSRAGNEIIREIQSYETEGTREILLLGQNVNSYGHGLREKTSFVDLLARIQAETNILRIRFTTSHPKDLTEDLIRCFADSKRLCKHLHLPVQAGSDKVLDLMNRGYTSAQYRGKIRRLREVCPDIALSSDVIVGFPGENEHDFEQTLELLEEVEFDHLFSFRYSDRPLAKSSGFPGKVDQEIKARRLVELQSRQAEITLSKNQAEVGAVREILVEGSSKAANGQLKGRTSQNRVVNLAAEGDLIGTLLRVRIVSAFSHSLGGRILPESR